MAPADIAPETFVTTNWAVPVVAAFLVLAAAVIVVAVVLIRRGKR